MSRRGLSERLGHCPNCGAELGAVDVLISYQARGEQRHGADCSNPRDVVQPDDGPT